MITNSLHTASLDDIKAGKVSDVYFSRTQEILQKLNIHKKVVVEFCAKSLPHGIPWAIFAGLEEALTVLQQLPIQVEAIPEGTLFRENDPVLFIEGDYLDFGIYETALLGFICQASGIATKAAQCRLAAKNRTLLSFGARRMHPGIAPMIERNAYIGGCDGVAVVKSAELLSINPSGTIPHALVLLMGDTVESIKAFDEIIDKKINRIALIDTFQDEKFESLRVAKAMGNRLFGVRLDTPGSRKGDFSAIIQEVRWELNLHGLENVKIVVSGGLDEESIAELQPFVDGFGVGTTLSNAPVIDFAMDIVSVEDKPIAKRGKMSGKKELFRCDKCFHSLVVPVGKLQKKTCDCGGNYQPMLQSFLENGNLTKPSSPAVEIRDRVLAQLNQLSD